MKRRIFAVILALCMLVGTPLSASAETNKNQLLTPEMEYISIVLPRYFSGSKIDAERIKVSNGFKILGNSDPNTNLYLIVSQDHCIGELLVSKDSNNAFISSFYELNNETLDYWIVNQCPMAFYLTNEQLSVQSGREQLIVADPDAIRCNLTPSDTVYSQNTPVFTDMVLSNTSLNRDIGYQKHIPLIIVHNDTVNGVWICWAACCAMVANYRIYSSFTALSMYYALKEYYGGTPEGTNLWYERAFTHYGMSYTQTGRMSGVNLYYALNAGRPVIFSLWNNIFGTSCHAIVLRAIELDDDGSGWYSFADPNQTSSYLNVVVADNSGTNFSITTNSGTYHLWKYSRY